jgi:hypothetical protein
MNNRVSAFRCGQARGAEMLMLRKHATFPSPGPTDHVVLLARQLWTYPPTTTKGTNGGPPMRTRKAITAMLPVLKSTRTSSIAMLTASIPYTLGIPPHLRPQPRAARSYELVDKLGRSFGLTYQLLSVPMNRIRTTMPCSPIARLRMRMRSEHGWNA